MDSGGRLAGKDDDLTDVKRRGNDAANTLRGLGIGGGSCYGLREPPPRVEEALINPDFLRIKWSSAQTNPVERESGKKKRNKQPPPTNLQLRPRLLSTLSLALLERRAASVA